MREKIVSKIPYQLLNESTNFKEVTQLGERPFDELTQNDLFKLTESKTMALILLMIGYETQTLEQYITKANLALVPGILTSELTALIMAAALGRLDILKELETNKDLMEMLQTDGYYSSKVMSGSICALWVKKEGYLAF